MLLSSHPLSGFSSNSSLLAATACGIARRENGAGKFLQATLPAGTGLISALVASPSKVWARSWSGQLLVSVDDGKNFAFATAKPLPPGVAFFVRGDAYSLAASDSAAVMSGCCAQSGPAPINGHQPNELIIYHVDTDTWSVEPILNSAGDAITDGTYVGGRRMVPSFNTPTGVRFFFCNSQAVWEVYLSGKRVGKYSLIASTGVDVLPPADANFAGGIHTDLWDFSLDPSGSVMWIAGDGGVYENRLDNTGWKATVDGLHTQHVQSLDVVLGPPQTRVIYATQDNSSWFGNFPNWIQAGPGDTNASDADAGNPKQAFLFRAFPSFDLISPDGSLPSFSSAAVPKSILADPHQPDRAGLIQFIQSIQGENGVPLDALTVVQRPVRDLQTPPNPISPPPSLSGIEQSGNPWLLRDKNWSVEPDFYRAVADGNWFAELKDLPDGTDASTPLEGMRHHDISPWCGNPPVSYSWKGAISAAKKFLPGSSRSMELSTGPPSANRSKAGMGRSS